MPINPNELSTETLEVLTELAEESGKRGKDLASTLRDAVNAYLARSAKSSESNGAPIAKPEEEEEEDTEFLALCNDELRALQKQYQDKPLTLAEVRDLLSEPGSLADEIIADRHRR